MKRALPLLVSFVVALMLCLLPARADEYPIKYLDKLKITSSAPAPSGDAVIVFNVYMPVARTAGQKFPAILMPNSWACNQYEYKDQAQAFARQGYVVLSYSTRGWGGSTGMIEAGGPGDMADVSALIDWLLANTPSDPNRIGMAGISYGAGISLLGAAHDARVKVVAALSGWASLFVSLDQNGTPSALWTKVLMLAAEATGGKLSPFMKTYAQAAATYQITDELRVSAEARSPYTFLNTYNKRKVAIFLSNNLQDNLFSAADAWQFYRQLSTSKRMLLNQGQHTMAEDPGLHGKPSYIWDQVHGFLDRYLAGVPGPSLGMPMGLTMMQAYQMTDYYAVDPSNEMQVTQQAFGLGQGATPTTGVLTPPDAPALNVSVTGGRTAASTGTPPSAIMEVFAMRDFTLPSVPIDHIDRTHAAVFLSTPLASALQLRGVPQATMTVSVSGSGSNQGNIAAQMVAYLYDVDEKGVGTLMSFGPVTLFGDPPENITIKMPMRMSAYNVAQGHRIGLVIGTEDPLYGLKASTWRHNTLTVRSQSADGVKAVISVPVLK